MKGLGETPGFEVRYVYAGRFQARWLGRSDEVHLISPLTGKTRGSRLLSFHGAEGRSFMVTLRPTRASVNANLYTDIPPWKGKNTLAYMQGLERDRRENKGGETCFYKQRLVGLCFCGTTTTGESPAGRERPAANGGGRLPG